MEKYYLLNTLISKEIVLLELFYKKHTNSALDIQKVFLRVYYLMRVKLNHIKKNFKKKNGLK